MNLPNISPSRLAFIKLVLHITQAVLVVLAILLTIAVFVTDGSTDARTGWYFGLCFLTVFFIFYLAMVPRFPRTRKLGNIYVFAALDAVSVILWLSAWACVANYVVEGKGHGKVENASGCDNFKYGSAAKCKISEATIIFGLVIMLLFIAAALISFQTVMEYKRTGILPEQGTTTGGRVTAKPPGGGATGPHGDDEAFDSNMNLRNDWEVEQYDHDDYNDRYGGDGTYGGTHDGRQGGYSQAAMDDHDDYDHDHQHYDHDGTGSAPPPAYGYGNTSDISGHQPTSHSSPLGGDTSYHSPAYGHGGR